MFHRRSSASSVGQHYPPAPLQFQRNRSIATSEPSVFHENGGGKSQSRNLSFSVLEDCDDNKYGKTLLNRHIFYSRILPCFIMLLLPWIPSQRTSWQVQSRRAAIDALLLEQKDMVLRLDETTMNLKELKTEIEILTKDNELSFREIHRNGREIAIDMESEQYAEIELEEEGLVKRIQKLENAIQKNSEKRLTERYGSGPYRLRVGVRDERGEQSFFVIETAMVMEMPHAIDHFVRMVEKKLWEGLVLVHEADAQIVMATPMSMDGSHTWASQRFVNANLTHMAFNEYSPAFPPPHHRKFSVAFSGRPGGPNFYINLSDEAEFSHEHESTFGVVLEGRDVFLKMLMQESGDPQSKRMLKIESIGLPEKRIDDA